MAKEDFMFTLYKNRMNLTIEVLDYLCMTLRLYENNWSKREVHNLCLKVFEILLKLFIYDI